jgi:hypothetical protein
MKEHTGWPNCLECGATWIWWKWGWYQKAKGMLLFKYEECDLDALRKYIYGKYQELALEVDKLSKLT